MITIYATTKKDIEKWILYVNNQMGKYRLGKSRIIGNSNSVDKIKYFTNNKDLEIVFKH